MKFRSMKNCHGVKKVFFLGGSGDGNQKGGEAFSFYLYFSVLFGFI